jgi:hypothetical protein
MSEAATEAATAATEAATEAEATTEAEAATAEATTAAATAATTAATPTSAATTTDEPQGALFRKTSGDDPAVTGPALMGLQGRIRRTFGAQANADAMLTTGGPALAAHASFDPEYSRAQGWIYQHAVGPAVLSPVVITGLVGTLVEAAFPQGVPLQQSMQHLRPLIVGVAVRAEIEVIQVTPLERPMTSTTEEQEQQGNDDGKDAKDTTYRRRHGYQVDLKTTVARDRDQVAIAEGRVSLWLPDYLRM